MLEARMKNAAVLKKMMDAITGLVNEANFECSETGIALQAMDNSHVALVTVELKADEFDHYRCDRNIPLGINLASLTKILKCAKDTDVVTLKAADDPDTLGLLFEASNSDRVGEYEMKLMDIDQEHLGIPDTAYDATVSLSSAEFQRIVRDLGPLGESVRIDASKEGVRFSAEGDIGTGSVLLKQTAGRSGKVKKEGGASKKAKPAKKRVNDSDDENEDIEEEDDVKPKVEEDEEEEEAAEEEEEEEEQEEEEDEEEEAPKSKKRKVANGKEKKPAKKAKTTDEEETGVSIILQQTVSLTFSLKYLQNFAKSAPLAKEVVLNMSNEVPLLVAFEFEQGHINFYLAPKIGDE